MLKVVLKEISRNYLFIAVEVAFLPDLLPLLVLLALLPFIPFLLAVPALPLHLLLPFLPFFLFLLFFLVLRLHVRDLRLIVSPSLMLLLEPLHFLSKIFLLLGGKLPILPFVLHHRQLPLHSLVDISLALLQLTHLHLAHIDLWQYQITCDLGVDPFDCFGIAIHLGGGQLPSLGNLLHLIVPQADHYILGLEVSVDDMAHAMHVVEADQALSSHLPHQRQWHPFVVISLNNLQEVDSEDFEDHDKVLAIRAVMDE